MNNQFGVSGLSVSRSISITEVGTSIVVPIAGCSSFLARIATLITNDFFSETEVEVYPTKRQDNLRTIFHEETVTKAKNG